MPTSTAVLVGKLNFLAEQYLPAREGWLLRGNVTPWMVHVRLGSDKPGSRPGLALPQPSCVTWAATYMSEPQFPHLERGTIILPLGAHVQIK